MPCLRGLEEGGQGISRLRDVNSIISHIVAGQDALPTGFGRGRARDFTPTGCKQHYLTYRGGARCPAYGVWKSAGKGFLAYGM